MKTLLNLKTVVAACLLLLAMPGIHQEKAQTGLGAGDAQASQAEDLPMHKDALPFHSIRQYALRNETSGLIFVIDGKVTNGFGEPCDFIRLKASLLDEHRKEVAVENQLAGIQLTLSQLQSFSERELRQALGDVEAIRARNTNVAPGAQVPFMFVFFNPPDAAEDFMVKPEGAKKAAR